MTTDQRASTPANRLALVHSDAYARWAFSETHPTQGRRFVHARALLLEAARRCEIDVIEIEADLMPTVAYLARVHDRAYIDEVLLDGRCEQWSGPRPDLGQLALRMAGGTVLALRALLDGTALTAVNFAGAKHHAMRDRSSGFCVFNDFALAARIALDDGLGIVDAVGGTSRPVERIMVIDIDAHHGDGVEALLREDPRVLTCSVHERGIFPGTGLGDDPEHLVFNFPLDPCSGDLDLAAAVEAFLIRAQRFTPDLVFVAIGADGHVDDPLSSLRYTVDGMSEVVRSIRLAMPRTPMLLGGAGGYRPDDATARAWASMSVAAALPTVDQDEADGPTGFGVGWRTADRGFGEAPCN